MLEKFKHVFLVLGVTLCMNPTVDHELVKLVREHVTQLSADVYRMKFENQEYKSSLSANVNVVQREVDVLHQELSSTAVKLDQLQSSHKASLQRITDLESQNNCSVPVTISYGKYKLHIILPC